MREEILRRRPMERRAESAFLASKGGKVGGEERKRRGTDSPIWSKERSES